MRMNFSRKIIATAVRSEMAARQSDRARFHHCPATKVFKRWNRSDGGSLTDGGSRENEGQSILNRLMLMKTLQRLH
jgi:hypothetical protein